MKARHILMGAPNEVSLEEFEFDLDSLKSHEIAISTQYSIVSAGTELAILAGIEGWA